MTAEKDSLRSRLAARLGFRQTADSAPEPPSQAQTRGTESPADTQGTPLFHVEDLHKYYAVERGTLQNQVGEVKAVDGIDLTVGAGETVGIVGESGCGKSTAARSMLRIEEPTSGAIYYRGDDIMEYSEAELKTFRRNAQLVFQDPETSFDPRMSVGRTITEPLRVQGVTDDATRKAIATDLLERVGLSADDINRYPHEFSGGQKQRIGLARALVVNPDLLIADEPVSALDVSIQSDILDLFDQFQEQLSLGIIIISHNLAVVREICDRVAVMYLGEIVESGPTEEIFTNPQHPYTNALLAAIPRPDPANPGAHATLSGTVPDPLNPPDGCRFHTRCPDVIPPADTTIDQQAWRGIVDLKQDIHNDTVTIRAAVAQTVSSETLADIEAQPDTPVTELLDDAIVTQALRDAYTIPETLADTEIETAVTEALDCVISSETTTDCTQLDEFQSICEQTAPETTRVQTDSVNPDEPLHTVSCHLNTQN